MRRAEAVLTVHRVAQGGPQDWEEGLEKGLEKGRMAGLEEGRLESMRLMMQNLNLSLPQVMDVLKIPSEKRDKYASLLS